MYSGSSLNAIGTWFLIPETKERDAEVVDFEEWQAAGRAKKAASAEK